MSFIDRRIFQNCTFRFGSNPEEGPPPPAPVLHVRSDMKITESPQGFLIQPDTSDESEHLRWLMRALSPRITSCDSTSQLPPDSPVQRTAGCQ